MGLNEETLVKDAILPLLEASSALDNVFVLCLWETDAGQRQV